MVHNKRNFLFCIFILSIYILSTVLSQNTAFTRVTLDINTSLAGILIGTRSEHDYGDALIIQGFKLACGDALITYNTITGQHGRSLILYIDNSKSPSVPTSSTCSKDALNKQIEWLQTTDAYKVTRLPTYPKQTITDDTKESDILLPLPQPPRWDGKVVQVSGLSISNVNIPTVCIDNDTLLCANSNATCSMILCDIETECSQDKQCGTDNCLDLSLYYIDSSNTILDPKTKVCMAISSAFGIISMSAVSIIAVILAIIYV